MKKIVNVFVLVLSLILMLSLVSCDGEDKSNNGEKANQEEINASGSTSSGKITGLSAGIQASMNAVNSLSGSNYFLASDGSILIMGNYEMYGLASVYATLPEIKKIVKGSTSAVFALSESGKLYYGDKLLGEGFEDVAYCTTNANVKGYCLKGSDIMRINGDELSEYNQNFQFRNMVTGDAVAGKLVSIEVDKHDFFVVNENGEFFACVNSNKQYVGLDFTGFENLILVEEAKHMDNGEVESLTIAGLKRDGSVVACGTYAEDILSWGKLSYITMSDGMIVGLTEDGMVKMTGTYADKMKAVVEGWTNIIAVEAGSAHGNNIGYIITAVDSDGTFYYASTTDRSNAIDTGSATTDGGSVGDRYWYKYSPDGNVYFSDNGAWELDD